MSTPRRRYSRIPAGVPEALPPSVSRGTSGRELYLCLLTSRLRGAVPGVIVGGEATIAEALDYSTAAVRRRLGELEGAGLLVRDRRLTFLLDAPGGDPPANEFVLRSWAAFLAELPPSPVLPAIVRAVAAAIEQGEGEKGHKLRAEWHRLTDSLRDSLGDSPADSPAVPYPSPFPLPVPLPDPQPQPPPDAAADVAPFLAAVPRVGLPAWAAAADQLAGEDKRQLAALGLQTWGAVLEAFAASFWLTDRGKAPPTLRRLITDAELRRKLLEGTYQDGSRAWRCAVCRGTHPAIEACPNGAGEDDGEAARLLAALKLKFGQATDDDAPAV